MAKGQRKFPKFLARLTEPADVPVSETGTTVWRGEEAGLEVKDCMDDKIEAPVGRRQTGEGFGLEE